MTNREKYAEEILDIVCSGMNAGVENNKVKACNEINCKDCDLYEKDNIYSECRKLFAKWVKQEYIPYVDWSKVAVDTPILVKNNEEEEKWVKRYFARYEDNKVFAWRVGTTSWSSNDYNDVLSWNHAKLPEEVEK